MFIGQDVTKLLWLTPRLEYAARLPSSLGLHSLPTSVNQHSAQIISLWT